MGSPTPKTTSAPEATKYCPMATAFSLIHSGAQPATGRSLRSAPRPPSRTISQQAIRMRELSTHEPECSTGGMPTVSQISRRPGPAFSLISGCNSPCLPLAMAMHPVWTTRMSFEIKLGDEVPVGRVAGELRRVAPDDADDAADAAVHDVVVERAIRGAEPAAEHVADGLVAEADHEVADLGRGFRPCRGSGGCQSRGRRSPWRPRARGARRTACAARR